ncbi:MAG: PEP-CTERM sorting domain-containing protein [Gammaproteobacteria bacterium]
MFSHVMRGLVLASVLCLCVVVPAEATMLTRLGGAAAYDDVLDITWVTNAALSGEGTWDTQVAWADGLDYLGFDDWRLASMSVAAGLPIGTTTSVFDCRSATEAQCRDNELGYMFYHNLGGTFGDFLRGNQTVDGVDLMNIQGVYWSGTEYDSGNAWGFPLDGMQDFDIKGLINFNGWAVRAGDVAAVPEPPVVWLIGSGLIGMIGVAKHKKAA